MEISLTLFNNIFDNKTSQKLSFKSFDSFEKALYGLSERKIKTKKDAPLMSPAVYKENTTRSNKNVDYWSGWCAVDVDDFIFDGDLKDGIIERTGDWRFICYSTASSTTALPKFRIVFPLTRKIQNGEIPAFNYALQNALGNLGDEQTKDLARMYYIPASYSGAFNFIFTGGSDYIDPDSLIAKYPMPQKANLNSFFDRLPEAIQKEIVNYRKDKLDANFEWSSYHDCPFWPKQLAVEYQSISNTGWYAKMYAIMIATAGNAVRRKYPISPAEISQLCRQFDQDNGNWYKNRPLDKEADRALEYVYKNI